MSLLKVDMTRLEVTLESFPKDIIAGGRAMVDYLLSEYGSPSANPLSEQSIFLVAPGLLAGTSAPQSGRLSVGGKSPLTGGIKEANVGGTAAHKLGRLGIRAILVGGKAKKWQILVINSVGATIEDAGNIVGLPNYLACDKLRQRYGDRIAIIVIGFAGEMKLANSTVAVTDIDGRPCRHAARGGVGAIMGAKGLKAIVIDDTGKSLRKAARQEAFKVATKAATKAIRSGEFTEILNKFGTAVVVDVANERGSLPTNNHRMGAFEKAENINAGKLIELIAARGGSIGHACLPGCVVHCSSIFNDSKSKFLTAALEYETIALLGSNLGIADLDAIARMDRKCDELGVDTIELGCTIGILNDVGLFSFGDEKRAEELLEEIAKGTLLGRIIGNGVVITAKIFGIDRVPAVKGQGIPGHSARSLKGWGVTYATSTQGADHTTGAVTDEPLSRKGQVERSRKAQITQAALDATGLCFFTYLMDSPEIVVPMINALYDIEWTVADYLEMGKEMLRQERAFNLKAGIGPDQDRLPEWMRKEPLPPSNAIFNVPQEEIDNFFNF